MANPKDNNKGKGKGNKFYEKFSQKDNPKLKDAHKGVQKKLKKKDEKEKKFVQPSAKKTFSSKDKVKGNPPQYDFKKVYETAKKKGKQISSSPDEVRLNRYISNSGICSRREADELIKKGEVKVNGKVVTEMGFRVKQGDRVEYNGKVLQGERFVYVLLNKPKGFLCTMKDDFGRKTVIDLVGNACEERIYPVGRLDRETVGLLLLTNDGDLAKRLTHPSNNIKKVYRVELNKPITEEHFNQIGEGIELEDGLIKPDDLARNNIDKTVLGIEIHSGKNRVVRRLFAHLGYEVTKLDRTTFAGLTKIDLPRGQWRYLTESELIRLKYMGNS